MRANTVFGVSLVYLFHGRIHVVISSQPAHSGGVAQARSLAALQQDGATSIERSVMHLVYPSGIGLLLLALAAGPNGVRTWLGGRKKPLATKIADLLLPEDILLDLRVSSKGQLIDQIGRHMERRHPLPHESATLSVDGIRVAYARLKSPISFDAPDGRAVSDALVLLVPRQAAERHLGILAEATRMLSDRRFRKQLESCKQPLEIKQLFDSWPDGPKRGCGAGKPASPRLRATASV
jgi:PTS system nitrogen regulatory IIA component